MENGRAAVNKIPHGGDRYDCCNLTDSQQFAADLAAANRKFPQNTDRRRGTPLSTACKQGDLAARNVLIERNLRPVAHIMKKY